MLSLGSRTCIPGHGAPFLANMWPQGSVGWGAVGASMIATNGCHMAFERGLRIQWYTNTLWTTATKSGCENRESFVGRIWIWEGSIPRVVVSASRRPHRSGQRSRCNSKPSFQWCERLPVARHRLFVGCRVGIYCQIMVIANLILKSLYCWGIRLPSPEHASVW